MKKGTKALKIILGIIAAPVILLVGLVLLDMLVGLGPFLSDFEVVNNSGADTWITPIGMTAGNGQYGPLPTYFSTLPAIPTRWWGLGRGRGRAYQIPLESFASVKILYDMDDINFRHILVHAQSGDVFIVDTNKVGDLHNCAPPQKDKYEIPALAVLPKTSPELLPCIEGKYISYSAAVEY